MNLAEIPFATAERHSPRRAVTDVRSGRSVSYGQLASEAERLAAFLKAEGVEPGQRIGLLAPNDVTYLPAAFGLLAAAFLIHHCARRVDYTPHDSAIMESLRALMESVLAWAGVSARRDSPGGASVAADA